MSDPSSGEGHPPFPTELQSIREALAADYDVQAELGRGGMAVVYRAIERELGRTVAIKVLPTAGARDGDTVTRFLAEARTAAGLEHPHIIPIHRVGRAGPLPYIAMKLVDGPSLGEVLAGRGALPTAEVRRILVETAAALGHAHDRGVVHRDVKPDNILLEPDGRCIVTDFGIAKVARSHRLTATGATIGTPRYMSPEQARALPLDGRSDLYALGVVAYECLTGRVPFDGDDPMAVLLAHCQDDPPVPRLADAAAKSLWAVIARLLEKKPERRYQRAADLLAALGVPVATAAALTMPMSTAEVARAASGPSAATRITPDPAATGLTRHLPAVPRRVLAGAAVAAVALLSAVTLVVLRGTRAEPASRCPSGPGTGIMLDSVPTLRPGDRLPVRYDVCGWPEGTALTTSIALRPLRSIRTGRSEAGVSTRVGEFASGPRSRRSRLLALPALSVGSYELRVVVRDARGRERSATTPVRLAW